MTPTDLRAWQASQGYTYESAAAALGISRSGYAKLLAGQSAIDRRTALACAAIMLGVLPWPAGQINTSAAQTGGLVNNVATDSC